MIRFALVIIGSFGPFPEVTFHVTHEQCERRAEERLPQLAAQGARIDYIACERHRIPQARRVVISTPPTFNE